MKKSPHLPPAMMTLDTCVATKAHNVLDHYVIFINLIARFA